MGKEVEKTAYARPWTMFGPPGGPEAAPAPVPPRPPDLRAPAGTPLPTAPRRSMTPAYFLTRWQASGGAERANYGLFLNDLTALLGIAR